MNLKNDKERQAPKTRSMKISYLGSMAAIFFLIIPIHSGAQSAATPTAAPILEEVIVRARKRSTVESAQDVPISMHAYSGNMLESGFVEDLSDLGKLIPAADLNPVTPIPGFANFSIRGMGPIGTVMTEDPTVAVSIDGMPLGLSAGAILETYDLESVEVLKGPQGTLFGRNSTGGAISLRSRRPSGEFGLKAEMGIGDHGSLGLAFAVENALIDDKLAGRLAVQYKSLDGYFDNTVTGDDFGERDFYMIRPTLSWSPNEDVTVNFIAEIGKDEGDGAPARNIFNANTLVSGRGFVPSDDEFTLSINDPSFNEFDWKHLIAEAEWSLNNGVVTSVTAWRDISQASSTDVDGSDLSIFFFQPSTDQEQFTQEIRWAGEVNDRTDLTVGMFYFNQDILYRERRNILGGLITPALVTIADHEQLAIFAQADIELTEQISATLGVRYTDESKAVRIASFGNCSFDFADCTFDQNLDEDWSNLNPKVGLQWVPNDDTLVYASWTVGNRSGGFNGRNPNPATIAGPYDEETVDAFELGMKKDFWGGRARFNAALYYNDFEDLQRTVLDQDNSQRTLNAASATISGVETDLTLALTEHFTLAASASYIDAGYDEFLGLDVDGDGVADPEAARQLDFFNVPELSYSLSATYETPLQLTNGKFASLALRASYFHRDEHASNIRNLIIYDSTDVLDVSATLTLPDERWKLSLFGKNLTEEQYGQGATATGLFWVDFLAAPRTLGLRASYEF